MHHGSCDLATMKIQKYSEILHFVANEHAAESGNIERCFVPQHDKVEALPRQLRVHLRTKNPAKPCSEPQDDKGKEGATAPFTWFIPRKKYAKAPLGPHADKRSALPRHSRTNPATSSNSRCHPPYWAGGRGRRRRCRRSRDCGCRAKRSCIPSPRDRSGRSPSAFAIGAVSDRSRARRRGPAVPAPCSGRSRSRHCRGSTGS